MNTCRVVPLSLVVWSVRCEKYRISCYSMIGWNCTGNKTILYLPVCGLNITFSSLTHEDKSISSYTDVRLTGTCDWFHVDMFNCFLFWRVISKERNMCDWVLLQWNSLLVTHINILPSLIISQKKAVKPVWTKCPISKKLKKKDRNAESTTLNPLICLPSRLSILPVLFFSGC